MKIRILISLMALISLVSCRTKKETGNYQPTPPQQRKELSEEERKKLVQTEYKPEVKSKVSEEDMKFLTNQAEEKANLTCKKQNIQKRINFGEQVDPSELTHIDSSIEEINNIMLKFASEPAYMQYFEEKFIEYVKECSN